MELFPAIDLRSGQAVRLYQGDYNQTTVYSPDPVSVAEDFKAQGARNLHLVDLDGAKDGTLSNFDTISAILKTEGLFVEVGGGIRDEERVRRYLDTGVGRVILGTAAVQQPDFLREMVRKYGPKIAVGVDARDGRVATHGWLETTGMDSFAFCETLRDWGVSTVIYTDISRDGGLQGTNLEAYRRLTRISGLDIVASGGITELAELSELEAMGTAGAILGKALYTGRLSLREAVALTRKEGS